VAIRVALGVLTVFDGIVAEPVTEGRGG
jgi:hypothetical protein